MMKSYTTYKPKAPIYAPVQEGKSCQLTPDWVALSLTSNEKINHNTHVFTFECPDKSESLFLSTCSCILATPNPNPDKGDTIVRPYTPISTNDRIGSFQLLIKIYPGGKMTSKLKDLKSGAKVYFKQIEFNIKIQYMPKVGFSGLKKFGMIVGGTGITPMIQVLNAILGDQDREDKDEIKVTMLYGNRTQQDMLANEVLNHWLEDETVKGRLEIHHVLSKEPVNSKWTGARGRITLDMIQKSFPDPSEECLIFLCGPPGMYKAMAGERGKDKPYEGLLKDAGYPESKVYKF